MGHRTAKRDFPLRALFCLALITVLTIPLTAAVLPSYGQDPPKEASKESPEKSKDDAGEEGPPDPGTPGQRPTSVKESLEELYHNYEVIDKRLREIKEDLGNLKTGTLVSPLTVTVRKRRGFRLISLEITDGDKPLWRHIYTPVENTAIEKGGRQRFYKGLALKGIHNYIIKYRYLMRGESNYRERELKWMLEVTDEPLFIEISFEKKKKVGIIALPTKLDISKGLKIE